MAFSLTDDDTMDTVVRCDECGEERRYNYLAGEPGEDWETADCQPTDAQSYDEFVEWACSDAADDHECHVVDGHDLRDRVICADCGKMCTDIADLDDHACARDTSEDCNCGVPNPHPGVPYDCPMHGPRE